MIVMMQLKTVPSQLVEYQRTYHDGFGYRDTSTAPPREEVNRTVVAKDIGFGLSTGHRGVPVRRGVRNPTQRCCMSAVFDDYNKQTLCAKMCVLAYAA